MKNNYWFENFKESPDYYCNLCRKLAKSAGFSALDLLGLQQQAFLVHQLTNKYDELLDSCGLRLPSDILTWWLKEYSTSDLDVNMEEFNTKLDKMIYSYSLIDESNLRPTLLALNKYVSDPDKFEVYVELRDIINFYEKYKHKHGVFGILHKKIYTFAATTDVSYQEFFRNINKLRKKESDCELHFIELNSEADEKFYSMYLHCKYLLGNLQFEVTELIPIDKLQLSFSNEVHQ